MSQVYGLNEAPLSDTDRAELRELFAKIRSGDEWLWWTQHPLDAWAGNVDVHTRSGWVVTVFIDGNDWDYVDSVRAPDGREWDSTDLLDWEWQDAICENWWRTTGTKHPEDHPWPPPLGQWPQPDDAKGGERT